MKQKYTQFGALLSNLRIQAGFNTQSDFAKAVEMGQQTLSRWESGASRPKSDQILKLAELLKTDPQLLLGAAGYTKTPQESPAILSFDKPFPFMSLTPDSFERFCCDLLTKTYPKASVHLWGGAGHKQDGIDIKVDHSDGSIHTFQCKRETEFGPQKVTEAIECQSINADKKYIMLARVASPQARQVASRHDGWNILDQDDLSRMVRNLSKHDQLRLVDTFFFGQRMALLGEPEPGIWRDSSSHFAPFMNSSRPLNHTLPLIGRQNESKQLYDACIEACNNNENSKRIIYLAGTAGIGKSRLLKHITDKIEVEHRDIRVWFWDAISTITSKDLESLGQGRKLLVVDGCRKAEALIPLFDFVFRNQNTTLIVATRFDEFDRIKSEAVDVGILGAMVEETRLNSLNESGTTMIALEILKLNHGNESMAKHIAKWTIDSPLATVLSTHFALKENISFAQIRAHKDYISIIKGKFSKVLVGEIGQKSDQIPIQQILKVLALVQPFEIHDARLIECIASIERLESVTIKRLLRILVEAGVLWKNQSDEYRLSPEVLSDLILEEVCLGSEVKSTGYADILYDTLDKRATHCIRNLIYNLGRFEWGKNMHNTPTEKIELLDTIWNKLNDTYEDIEIVERIAYYQPKKTLEFVKKVMMARLTGCGKNDGFVETNASQIQDLKLYDKQSPEYLNKMGVFFVNEINQYFQVTMYPKAIFDDLTPIIQTVAQHRDFLAQACSLLWEMSKYYDASSQGLSANYNHPIRILEEIFSFKPDKPQEYLTVAVDWAINLLQKYHAEEYRFSPFDFLSEIMKTDGATTEVSGHSITTTEFTINDYDSVAPLRSKVIEAFLKTLVSPDIKKSYEAAKFLPNCLAYSNNDKCVWTEEAINTLKKINMLVKDQKIRNYALIVLSLEIDQLLLKGEYPISRSLRDIQTQIHKTIQNDKELCISAVMLGKWDWLQSKDKTHVKTYGEVIHSMFDKGIEDLDALYDLVNSKYRAISLIGKENNVSFNRFFAKLCDANLEFSEHCVQQALNPKTNDNLWQFAWIPLSMLLHYEQSKGQPYASKLLESSDCQQRELVGRAYGNLNMQSYDLQKVDRSLLTQVLNDIDEEVLLSGIGAVKSIAFIGNKYQAALELLCFVRKSVSINIIGEMFEIVRHAPLKLFSEEEIQKSTKAMQYDPIVRELRAHNNDQDSYVSSLKTKQHEKEMFPAELFEKLCEYLIALPEIPSSYNDGVGGFLLRIIDLYPEIVLDLVLNRAEHAVKNKLFERTFSPNYQIIDMQFLNRKTNGIFPKDHRGIRNSETFLSVLRNIPNVKNTINQWLEAHKDDSNTKGTPNSYENIKQFLLVEILGEPAFDKKADKLMEVKTKHIFKGARDYINKTFPNKGDNGWLACHDADQAIKEFNDIIQDAFITFDKLNQDERSFAQNKWRESRENQKFTEEIKPLYDVFKGYLKADQQTLDHSIDCFDIQAIIIRFNSSDNISEQRYALQLFPSQETQEELKVPSRIKFCGDREQYDGCIEFSDGEQQKVEVTVANKGAEQGKLKTNMRQNGYAMHLINDDERVAEKCLQAIKNKLNEDKHKDKYTECWLMVVLNGWPFESIDDIESFLHFFKEIMQTERYSIDWTKIKSIIICPGS